MFMFLRRFFRLLPPKAIGGKNWRAIYSVFLPIAKRLAKLSKVLSSDSTLQQTVHGLLILIKEHFNTRNTYNV